MCVQREQIIFWESKRQIAQVSVLWPARPGDLHCLVHSPVLHCIVFTSSFILAGSVHSREFPRHVSNSDVVKSPKLLSQRRGMAWGVCILLSVLPNDALVSLRSVSCRWNPAELCLQIGPPCIQAMFIGCVQGSLRCSCPQRGISLEVVVDIAVGIQ